jgi:hypothetical protein
MNPLESRKQLLIAESELNRTHLVGDGTALTADLRTLTARAKSLGTILLIVLVLMLLGALPTWPHSRSWGYYPSGGLGLVAVILVVLPLLGRI